MFIEIISLCAQIVKTTIWSRHFQAPTIFLNCYCLYIPCSAIDTLAKERGHAATTTKFYTSCITHVFSCLAIEQKIPGIGIGYKRFGQVSAFLRLKRDTIIAITERVSAKISCMLNKKIKNVKWFVEAWKMFLFTIPLYFLTTYWRNNTAVNFSKYKNVRRVSVISVIFRWLVQGGLARTAFTSGNIFLYRCSIIDL